MSLTAFQRFRRLKQIEKMKPENIKAEEIKEEPKQLPELPEIKEEPKPTSRRRNSRK